MALSVRSPAASLPPNVEDNLAASATPITVDPQAGSLRSRRIQQLVAQGMTPEQAAAAADRDLAHLARKRELMAGGMSEEQATVAAGREMVQDDFPEPAPAQPAVATPQQQAEEPLDVPNQFGEYEYDPETKSVRQRPMAAPPAETRAGGMTAPGPRTLDGREPRAPRPLNTPEEIEAYEVRPENGLSQRDRDMAARGYVPVVTPNGVTYMVSAESGGLDGVGGVRFPGGPGRAGNQRPDLVEGGWVVEERQMPDGRRTQVYVPGPEMRAKQEQGLADRQTAYKQKKADMDKQRAEARDRWRATAILAGGSHNLNSGNRWIANALYGMKPDERAAAMRYMLPGAQLHAAVDAQQLQTAAALAQRALTGAIAGQAGGPLAAEQVAQQRNERQREIVDWAESNINDNYAYDADSWWGASEFTDIEFESAVDDLLVRYGPPNGNLTEAEARQIVSSIATRKRRPKAAGEPEPEPKPMPPAL